MNISPEVSRQSARHSPPPPAPREAGRAMLRSIAQECIPGCMQRQQNLLPAEFVGSQSSFRVVQLLPDEYGTLNQPESAIRIRVPCPATQQQTVSLPLTTFILVLLDSLPFPSIPSMLSTTIHHPYSTY
jgi:hypothetical protein